MQPKVMIATPAYSGNVSTSYAMSLAQSYLELTFNKVLVSLQIGKSGSLLAAERNRIVQAFWDSDATHLMCIDADVSWENDSILKLLAHNKEFVCGVYPCRKEDKTSNQYIFKPHTNEDGTVVIQDNLIKAQGVPAGFMLISREAVKKMRNFHSDLYYSPKDPRDTSESAYCLFNTEIIDGEFWGEDYVFCKRAEEAGVEIFIDPTIQFEHAGFVGKLTDILYSKE